jgi:hypothetical protein
MRTFRSLATPGPVPAKKTFVGKVRWPGWGGDQVKLCERDRNPHNPCQSESNKGWLHPHASRAALGRRQVRELRSRQNTRPRSYIL